MHANCGGQTIDANNGAALATPSLPIALGDACLDGPDNFQLPWFAADSAWLFNAARDREQTERVRALFKKAGGSQFVWLQAEPVPAMSRFMRWLKQK
jgi:hypothetical protein